MELGRHVGQGDPAPGSPSRELQPREGLHGGDIRFDEGADVAHERFHRLGRS